jgi:release factor glutamine methyltransferase
MVQAFDERLIPPGSTVLDVGTGSGIGAVFSAQWARQVTAVDINPAAVRCARINVLLNEMEERVEVCQGDLFTPVHGERFDVVLFNPPYYRGEPQNMLDHAFHANDVVERFTAALPDHLTPAGHALVLLSTTGDAEAFLSLFRRHGFRVAVAARRDIASEIVTLYQIRCR